jgi:hypothetical protein
LYFSLPFLKVPNYPASNSDILPSGECLGINQNIVSSNGAYFLNMQSDGNLVFYNPSTQATGTLLASGGVKVCMLAEGKLIMVNSAGNIVWTFPIIGITGSYAQM